MEPFHWVNAGFIGHLIERSLCDVKAKRIEGGIQADDRTVAEINQLSIAELEVGYFSTTSHRPQAREKRQRQRNMECKSPFRWHDQRTASHRATAPHARETHPCS